MESVGCLTRIFLNIREHYMVDRCLEVSAFSYFPGAKCFKCKYNRRAFDYGKWAKRWEMLLIGCVCISHMKRYGYGYELFIHHRSFDVL